MMLQAINNSTAPQFKAVVVKHRTTVGPEDKEFYSHMRNVLSSKQCPRDLQMFRTTKDGTYMDYIYLFFGLKKQDEGTLYQLMQQEQLNPTQSDFFFIGKNRTMSLEGLKNKQLSKIGISADEAMKAEKRNHLKYFF